MMAHSPEVNRELPAPSRPPYLNVPSFIISIRVCTCLTWMGLLIFNTASSPSMPLALVASGTLWIALKFSNCVQVGHDVVKPQAAALAARIFFAASRVSSQVRGGLLGSRPAFLKASLLYQVMGVERLN